MRTRLKELKRDLLKEIRDLLTEKHLGSFEFHESEIYTNVVNDLTGCIDSYRAVGLDMIGDTIVIEWVEASLFDDDVNLEAQTMLIRESVENLVKIHEVLNG